ncbi:MAG: HAD-IC family P-type ATPase, partial [Bdellovibrionota bacterium]
NDETAKLLCTAESGSEHHLGKAFARFAAQKKWDLESPNLVRTIPGKGIRARVRGKEVVAGTLAFLSENGVPDHPVAADAERRFSEAGHTPIRVAVDRQLRAVYSLADQPRVEAASVITRLQEMGIEVQLITGDRKATGEAVAKRLGIDLVRAEVLPEGKSEIVKELLKSGRNVAMVGDGINDAPALALASVGIAMGSGTEIAMESAGVTLLRSDLNLVIDSIVLSRATMRTIRQNLFASFVYNCLGIPLAAGLLTPLTGWTLNPMIAGGAMALSSVSVLINSLRLKKVKLA